MDFISYLITDPKYYTDEKESFTKQLEKVFIKHKVDMASFRDKLSTEIDELAKTFIEVCKKYDIEKTIINTDIELALKYNFFGIHLTSKQFDKIKECKEKSLYVIISCHDFDEIKKAYDLGADAITYSPIFYTPFKGKPKGIESLKALVDKVKVIKNRDFKIIGLGGVIDSEHIDQIKSTGADGFASIRYFVD